MASHEPDRLRAWAVIPAAGSGARMGGDRPKQYLQLAGEAIVMRTLARIRAEPRLDGVVVVIAADDPFWPQLTLPETGCPLWVALGGQERCHSVRNGLHKLLERGARRSDWVLVHDAARPCLSGADLSRLLDTLWEDSVGGLLAVPVADTLKRVDSDRRVLQTVSREQMWRAQTPQMFRLGMLLDGLNQSLDSELLVTDEAQAIENAGWQPRVVPGSEDNLKITRPADLEFARDVLRRQGDEL